MSMSKTQAMKELERSAVSNQQSLVKKIEGIKQTKILRRAIPGGKQLLDNVNRETLPKACYTWLRHCAHFTHFTVSFAKDIESTDTRKVKSLDFDPRSTNLEWDLRGKKWLGEQVASLLLQEKAIAVEGNKEGLWVHYAKEDLLPESDDWEPYVEFHRFKPNAQ
jgi:hypothetical protein